jgi:indole-3-glycerol phosphate synthase
MDERSGFAKFVASTEAAVASREREWPLEAVRDAAAQRSGSRRFRDALSGPNVSIIAEFKRASPSRGTLARDSGVGAAVQRYERGGASAVSVLTEAKLFRGSQADLACARDACSLPILCKDFILQEFQVFEARACGADAILLIAAILDKARLKELRALARSLELDVLVEVRDSGELDGALAAGADLIGINNRDLEQFVVDLQTTRVLSPQIPGDVVKVSESGLKNPSDMVELASLGVDAALIGTALMVAADPEETCRDLVEATRGAIARSGIARGDAPRRTATAA